jgi:ribose transport system substrate-binding protein
MRGRHILMAIAAAASLGTIAGCAAETGRVDRIGLAVANLQADFFNQIKQSVETYAAEQGIDVITVDARGDGATQVSQVQDLLTQGIDALIYIPAGAAAATVPTRLARAQGVPVVNVDRNADDEPGDTFITSDSVTSAYEVCRYLFEQVDGAGQMIIIHGQRGTTPEVDRTTGCARAVDE